MVFTDVTCYTTYDKVRLFEVIVKYTADILIWVFLRHYKVRKTCFSADNYIPGFDRGYV